MATLAHASLAAADPEASSAVSALAPAPVVEVPVVVAPAPVPRSRRAWPQPALGPSTSGGPEVLFTFDDGPNGASTVSVLDTLRAHGVKAVFFMIGRNVRGGSPARNAALIERIVAEGHVVGNHTDNHRDLCLRANAARIGDEIDQAARQISAAARMNPVYFRAPYGVRCPKLEEALDARGVRHLHWDVDPQEWRTHDAARMQAVITADIARLRDDERAVILAHDVHATTVTALPVILEWIRAENQRRAATGRQRIRILSPSDVAVEQLAPPVRAWFTAIELGAGLPELAQRLVAPLTSPRAQAGVPSL